MIYLDYNSTHPMLSEVKTIIRSWPLLPSNPSATHGYGRKAKATLEHCRSDILNLLGLSEEKYGLVFTASGTESNNQVIRTFTEKTILVTESEHLSVLAPARENNQLLIVEVKSDGLIDLLALQAQLLDLKSKDQLPPGFLLSAMHVNNETGVVQDIRSIASIVHRFGGLLHCDIMQSIGKITIDIVDYDIDYCTFCSHKIGGLHGAAAIVYKKDLPLKPLLTGGGQEFSVRSGTENLLAIVTFSIALRSVLYKLQSYIYHTQKLQTFLEKEIERNGGIVIAKYNQDSASDDFAAHQLTSRVTNTSNIIMPGVENIVQLMQFDLAGIMVSNGSSCSSGKVAISHVLKAMGYEDDLAGCAIRVSWSHQTTITEIKKFLEQWCAIANR